MLKQQIDQDLKTALLSKNQLAVDTLRGVKSAILNVEVALNLREEGLDDTRIIDVLSKESKKRAESADLYSENDNQDRADTELKEKSIIDKYLPEQLSDSDIEKIVDEVISNTDHPSIKDMGKIIGQVKIKTGVAGDGSKIASIVKSRLNT
jgi:uncharacterized protein